MPEQQNIDLNELNRTSYDKIAGEFSATRGYSWKDVDYLFEFVKSGDKILDVGCGNGRLLGNSKHKIQSTNYIGVDNSEQLIGEARKKYPEFKFEIVDLLTMNDLHDKFDTAFCVSFLNHFPKEKQNQVLQNLKALLKPGGYLLMVNWNLWNVFNKKSVWFKLRRDPSHELGVTHLRDRNVMTTWKSGDKEVPLYYYAFTKGELAKLLQKNGFEVVENFYVKNGKKSSWLFGNNILTVGKLTV
ncbi:MAG: class I SAM-dependent methyltransferase [Parcubacteria group bacterium]